MEEPLSNSNGTSQTIASPVQPARDPPPLNPGQREPAMASQRIPRALNNLTRQPTSLSSIISHPRHLRNSLRQAPINGSLPSSVRFGSDAPHYSSVVSHSHLFVTFEKTRNTHIYLNRLLLLLPLDQPSGWLFGEKPLKPGEKRVREDWELIWYIGFWGTTFVGIMMQVYKPDRSLSSFFSNLISFDFPRLSFLSLFRLNLTLVYVLHLCISI
ncbi:hypothetical protein PSHT_03344 [Puccinia striiformis]|uniref:Uncharacterized protein n=1 Tax=Puccinia striiformis TaxID=27350 RepID=A0A2S4WFP7_9BASI|nr:hypothetical protein PSHT_03344 [Puccinia striiformis]